MVTYTDSSYAPDGDKSHGGAVTFWGNVSNSVAELQATAGYNKLRRDGACGRPLWLPADGISGVLY